MQIYVAIICERDKIVLNPPSLAVSSQGIFKQFQRFPVVSETQTPMPVGSEAISVVRRAFEEVAGAMG
jgi:hypothetical protein